MSVQIQTVLDHKRMCGFRKPGLYLMGTAEFAPCGKMPIELSVCPYCNGGIHVTRSLQKINLNMLVRDKPCRSEMCYGCITDSTQWAYLMSVGEKFYPNTHNFTREAVDYGISKRIHAIPRGFKVGESVVALAHKKGTMVSIPRDPIVVNDGNPESMFFNINGVVARPVIIEPRPAIFMLFRPNRIEYVTKGDETEEFLNGLAKRNITPVKVVYETQMEVETNTERVEGSNNE